MDTKPFLLKPGDRRSALNVIGTEVTVLASEADIRDLQITVQTGDDGTRRSNAASMSAALDRDIPPGSLNVGRVIEVLSQNGVKVHV